MKKYLLDTSICVFLFRDNHDVAQRLNKIGRERCFICDVVLAELRYGAYKSNRTEENLQLIDDFVKEIKVLPEIPVGMVPSASFFASAAFSA